jgi:hypothetical protein
VNENELGVIKGLLHYLNDAVDPATKNIDAEVKLSDSNGESLGLVVWDTGEEAYVFRPL